MMQDVQSFARRQPTAFLGISFLAGFAAIRFLRSGPSGAGMSSSDGGRWQDREPSNDGRYGGSSGNWQGSGAGRDADRFGAASSGRTPGSGL